VAVDCVIVGVATSSGFGDPLLASTSTLLIVFPPPAVRLQLFRCRRLSPLKWILLDLDVNVVRVG
jgi:hypothetical protein